MGAIMRLAKSYRAQRKAAAKVAREVWRDVVVNWVQISNHKAFQMKHSKESN